MVYKFNRLLSLWVEIKSLKSDWEQVTRLNYKSKELIVCKFDHPGGREGGRVVGPFTQLLHLERIACGCSTHEPHQNIVPLPSAVPPMNHTKTLCPYPVRSSRKLAIIILLMWTLQFMLQADENCKYNNY